jgi:myo-inositol 2-dehydrogenase / D-chiro-inositol 1-dehydrogenase
MRDITNSSRRDFLKSSTAVAAGVALAGGLSFARSAHAAGSDELKIALIGCGGRGTGAVVNCLGSVPNVKLIAVADVFENNAKDSLANLQKTEECKGKIDVPTERIFVGFDAYQKAIAAGPDVVFLATPPGLRPIHYAAAIQAGKHVFMEKPCCVDAPGFRSLMETNKLADEKNLKVVVGLQRRYQAGYVAGMKKIHDGAIGDLVLLRAYWDGGEPWFRERVAGQTEMEYQLRNWYHFVWICGDNICEQHVHNLDVCNWAKNDHPIEANGMGACVQRYAHRDPKKGSGQIFDSHFVEFTYKDGSKMYSQCRQIPNTWNSVSEAVHGTKGVSNCQADGKSLGFRDNPYEQEHVALFDAIRKNEKHNDGWYGATSSMTAVMGRMATYSGQVVKWDDAVAKGPDEMPKKFAFDADPPAMPDKNGLYPIPVPGIYKPF